MTASFNLEAYLQRIGYAGQRAPTLDTLRVLVARHTDAIAFENLNPVLGWPVKLDVASLQQKLVRDGRGGYCFEQNLLLRHALETLGFRVTGLEAGVLWNASTDAIPARTHMLLRIDLDEGPYVADVGFGVMTSTGPLRLELGTEQATPHEPFRLIAAGEDFVMQARLRGNWKALYRFDLQAQVLRDYEISNWYISQHPDSQFVQSLIAGRPAKDRRYALRNNELAVHHLRGETERRVLATAAELRATLENAFLLTLPDAPELDAALVRLTAATRMD